jgi:histidine triad (HIT) family protein
MSSIFTRIINGEIPCYKVAEDEAHIAFLDIQPVAPGHVLVVPKKEVDYIFDLNSSDYAALWTFAHKVATGLRLAVPCLKVGISVIGLEVPHTHIHLVPIYSIGDINFSKPKLSPDPEELELLRQKIVNSLA